MRLRIFGIARRGRRQSDELKDIRTRLSTAIALAGLAALPHPAHAQIIAAGATWIVDTSSAQGDVEAKKGKSFSRLPVLPQKLIRIKDPVIDIGTTGVKISAGKQFVGYRLENGKTVYCSSQTLDMMKDGGSIIYFRYEGTYACLVDQDDDGKLDGIYEVKSRLMSRIPVITHGKASGYETINPIAFEELDRKEFNNPINLELVWWRGKGVGDRFQVVPRLVTEKRDTLDLLFYFGLDRGQFPGSFNALGIEFNVSGELPNKARIRMDPKVPTVTMMTTGDQVGFAGGE